MNDGGRRNLVDDEEQDSSRSSRTEEEIGVNGVREEVDDPKEDDNQIVFSASDSFTVTPLGSTNAEVGDYENKEDEESLTLNQDVLIKNDRKILKAVLAKGALDRGKGYWIYMITAQGVTFYLVSYLVYEVFSKVAEPIADDYPGRGIPVLDFFARHSPEITGIVNAILNPYFQMKFFDYFWNIVTFNQLRKQVGLPTPWRKDLFKILATFSLAVPSAAAFVFLDDKLELMISDGITFTVQNFLGSMVLVEGIIRVPEAVKFVKKNGLKILEVPPHYLIEMAKELLYILTFGHYAFQRSNSPLKMNPKSSTLLEFKKNIEEEDKNKKKKEKIKLDDKDNKENNWRIVASRVNAYATSKLNSNASDNEFTPLKNRTDRGQPDKNFCWEQSKIRQCFRMSVTLMMIMVMSDSIMRIFTLNTQRSMEEENWFPEQANKELTWGLAIFCISMFGMLVVKSVKGVTDSVQDRIEGYIKSTKAAVDLGLWQQMKKSLTTREFFTSRSKEVIALFSLFIAFFSAGTVLGLAEKEGVDDTLTTAATLFITPLFNMIGLAYLCLFIIDGCVNHATKSPGRRNFEARLDRLGEYAEYAKAHGEDQEKQQVEDTNPGIVSGPVGLGLGD